MPLAVVFADVSAALQDNESENIYMFVCFFLCVIPGSGDVV